MTEKVQTVLGPVHPGTLGRTLTHEHFSLKFDKFYVAPPKHLEKFLGGDIYINNVGLIRQYPYSNKFNLSFCDSETHNAVEKDVLLYKELGGGTIVENTSHGLGRDLALMKKISLATNINVIAGTGHYVALVQPENVLKQTKEQLYDTMLTELTQGCKEETSIKCGFIGEVGSSWPLHDFEIRAIQATAQVQEQLNCPVSFHPGRNEKAPFEIIRLFLESGGKVKKTVMSHLDRTISDSETLLEFSSLGTYCQFDLFGTECSYYQLDPATDMPSDAERLNRIKSLIDNGCINQILLSHDIHTKHRLVNFGGHGFSHILTNVLPKMLLKNVPQETIDQISVNNPSKWLSWKCD